MAISTISANSVAIFGVFPKLNYGLKPILQLKTPTLTVYIFVGVLHIEEKRSTELADISSYPQPQGLGLSK